MLDEDTSHSLVPGSLNLSRHARTTIRDVPYEMVHEVTTYLPLSDIMTLSYTCRELYYPVIQDESIWQRFCYLYGVMDLAPFGGRTFRTLYTRWLHRYGPLLGLWASDNILRGSVIEFRIAPNKWDPDGIPVIVGEAWSVEHHTTGPPGPTHPRYIEFVQIGFHLTQQSADEVTTTWRVNSEELVMLPWHTYDVTPEWELGKVFSRRSYVLLQNGEATPHPTLCDVHPGDGRPWHDANREALRVQTLQHIYEQPGAFLEGGSSDLEASSSRTLTYKVVPTERAALCINAPHWCRNTAQWALIAPFSHVVEVAMLNSPPRFYPLRMHTETGMDPTLPDWHVDTLHGLWLGDYGAQLKTEVLWLQSGPGDEVRAWKVTGDPHVPRGQLSWMTTMNAAHEVNVNQFYGLLNGLQVRPTGSIRAFSGFMHAGDGRLMKLQSIIFLTGPNTIVVVWLGSGTLFTFTRYVGRQIN
ncbi:hypothetical protein CERSUDRAFT_118615 [Gelatoporia subvermispora B]|uniref:F-box domain-containing protein n=1 Tax=Ceriporiopsis subvermispora (strain B) TaxID=914234 RepID=M2R134_CERS8|nr:hypothetical protein CERSUDRAFT_118615 [Gelatoporia subvermispora B]